jgi:hypothetical protein
MTKWHGEYDPFHLKIYLFVHFMVQILFSGSYNVQIVISFKILNDVLDCTLLDL